MIKKVKEHRSNMRAKIEDIRKKSHTSKTSRVKKSVSDMKHILDEISSGRDIGEENFNKLKT